MAMGQIEIAYKTTKSGKVVPKPPSKQPKYESNYYRVYYLKNKAFLNERKTFMNRLKRQRENEEDAAEAAEEERLTKIAEKNLIPEIVVDYTGEQIQEIINQ